ncbi:DUF3592 domain-containing protein [Streptomyces rubellomurinus]|uniref:DUF3592 domain-containing protein n=1 Tax=Streptomyces rubellomurinus (strain ATCC 31215) TaxID=359131 RepID=UPI0012FE8478|nr:DUF3592 domain-containing protein [Streptomyces rubellomurinus]
MSPLLLVFGSATGTLAGCLARETHRVHVIRNRGVRTTGWVDRIRTDTDGDGDLQHFPVVRFELPDGTEIEAGSATGMPHSCSLAPGDPVETAYHPRQPENIVIIGFDWPANPWVFGLCTLLLGGFSATMLWDGFHMP